MWRRLIDNYKRISIGIMIEIFKVAAVSGEHVALFALVFWLSAVLVAPVLAADMGQSWKIVLLVSFFFGWIGALIAMSRLRIDQDKADDRYAASQGRATREGLERDRRVAELKAMGRREPVRGEMSEDRKRRLQALLGGPRR